MRSRLRLRYLSRRNQLSMESVQDFGGQENATVDPFSVPLAPLTSTAATVSPFSSPLPEGQGDPVALTAASGSVYFDEWAAGDVV